jgi:hypothetical protein
MEIKVKDIEDIVRKESFEDDNVARRCIYGLNGTDLDENLTGKFRECQFSEIFKKPIIRHRKISISNENGTKEEDITEKITEMIFEYEISKYELFATRRHNVGAFGGDWIGRHSMTEGYQNAMLEKYGKEYALDLRKYAKSQITQRQNVVDQIEGALATGFETFTLVHKKQEKTFSRKDKEFLANYSQKLQNDIQKWQKYVDRAENFLQGEIENN